MAFHQKNLTLVVLAAGLGSRYGGVKQLEPIGSNQEILIDYSFYDAIRCGFNKIVCVIRKEIEKDFYNLITKKWENIVEIKHVYQNHDSFVPNPQIFKNRTKPWGTGHAILCAKNEVKEPFLAINADDFYGHSSFQKMAHFLLEMDDKTNIFALVAFELHNTLSSNGSVSRGICKTSQSNYLLNIEEHKNIYFENDKILSENAEHKIELLPLTPVSMNFWGFPYSIFTSLENDFHRFLQSIKEYQTSEFFIPKFVDNLVSKHEATVKVLHSGEKWLGITYRKDTSFVKESIKKLIDNGVYPHNLR